MTTLNQKIIVSIFAVMLLIFGLHSIGHAAAPEFTDGDSTSRSVVENTPADVNIGNAVTATDADNDTLTYTLGGTDAASFDIDSETGQLKTKSALDHDTKSSYTVTITVSDDTDSDTITVTITVTAAINIPGAGLRAKLESALNKQSGHPISAEEMATLTSFSASSPNISDLTGLEHATNLTWLHLSGNSISNLSPLEKLTNLTQLSLWYTGVSNLSPLEKLTNLTKIQFRGNPSLSDISPLEKLTNLTWLHLSGSSISNLSPLEKLTNLTSLALFNNSISNISAVAKLTKLVNLNLHINSISNISAVSGLTNLANLYLSNNSISDISHLATNTGLGSGDTVYVKNNLLSYPSINTHIPTLTGRGVTVTFDSRTPTTLLKISGDDQQGNPGTALPNPFVVQVKDQDNKVFKGVPVTFTITTGSGTLSTTSTTTDGGGRAESTLTLGSTPEKNTVSVSAIGIQAPVIFNTQTEDTTNSAPTFTDGDSTTREIAENTAADTNIGDAVVATDDDDGATLTYTLSGTDAASFDIDSGTGQLKTKAALDYGTKSSYTVTLTVSDGSLTDTITVTITVTNVNDAPAFLSETATRSIAENTAADQNIGAPVEAANDDSDDALIYTLGGTDAASFDIDSGTGQLKTKAALDHETKSSYTVTITVSDGSFTDTITVTITVTDVNESPTNSAPTFTDGDSTTRSVVENTPADVNIGDPVAATDTDNDPLTYSLGGTDEASFSIDSETGQLKTKAALDHDTKSSYTVTITVSDGTDSDTITVTITVTAAISIPDSNLRAKLESVLNKQSGHPITAAEMATLTSLIAYGANISDLTGLEHATNLTSLNLGDNSLSNISAVSGLINLTSLEIEAISVSDISAVSGLTNLTSLNLGYNSLSNISAVSSLTNLTSLHLGANSISNISAVSSLTNLTWLNLSTNSISNISAVSGLTNLTHLYLGYNSLSNISEVSGLTNLTSLNLDNNSISDLSPLVANTGLGSGDTVSVGLNPLSYPSIHTHIPTLQSRGVTVQFDTRTPTKLLKISGDNQVGAPSTALANPFVVEVKGRYDKVFEGVPVTFTVTAGGGSVNTTNTTTDANGRAQTTLTLGSESGTNTVSVSVEGSSNTVTFNDTVAVNIPDANLRAKIETAVNKQAGDPITEADMATLTRLTASGTNISDLTGLEHATNLTSLSLWSNSISDISAVAGLTQLTSLGLHNNLISNISAVAGLTQLTSLGLNSNSISDISAVAGLTNLTELHLGSNSIADISAVAGLTNLTTLWLSQNSISNISAVAGLTNLTSLYLHNNSTSGISNSISDISPLVANTGLGSGDTVSVRLNPLSYASIYTHIPTLQSRGITVRYSNRIPTTLMKISGLVTASDNLLVVEVQDWLGTPFAGVPVTFTVILGSGTLSVTSTTTNAKGRAESRLTLEQDGDTYTVHASVEEISEPAVFTSREGIAVNIPDANLRAKIESALNKQTGDSISEVEMGTLTSFSANSSTISDLTGLEHATNLTSLSLYINSISDISAVAGLTKLTSLSLRDNSISDISAVAGLTKLTSLSLWSNSISDISAVAGLTKLTSLSLYNNSISDISAIAGLTNLTYLELRNNSISDISAVAGLTQLTSHSLSNNSISDLSPLVANTGLGSGNTVSARRNPLSYASITTHIPTLQNRGVTVYFDNRIPTTLLKISGDNQQGTPGTALPNPFVVEVQDSNRKTFEGVPVTFTVTSGGGSLSTTSTTTDADGRAESTLTLGNTPGTNTVSVSATGIQEISTFTVTISVSIVGEVAPVFTEGESTTRAVAENTEADVNIGDPVEATDANDGDTLTYTLDGTDAESFDIDSGTGQLKTKTELDYETKASYTVTITVSDGNLTDLITVTISISNINDVAPAFTEGDTTTRSIAETTEAGTNIGDPVETTDVDSDTLAYSLGGTDAGSFDIDSETGQLKTKGTLDYETKSSYTVTVTVSDGSLTDEITVTINVVDIDESQGTAVNIPDFNLRAKIESALNKQSGDPITTAEMATLTSLHAGNSNISDLTGLEHATNLTSLFLNNNPGPAYGPYNSISDISAVAGLTRLRALSLSANSISDISAVAGLTNLTSLSLYSNSISDISAVAGLTNLTSLMLGWNSISDISAVAGLTKLTSLMLAGSSISDISAVAGLTKLTSLRLEENSISDISAVAGLTKLTTLWLSHNSISDISPLVTNTGLGSGDTVSLHHNPLSYASITTHIPTLQSRGVTVSFSKRTPTKLLKISGTITASDNLLVVEVHDGSGTPFAGVPVTFTVISGGGTLSNTSTTTNANGRAESRLTLGGDGNTNTVRATVEGIPDEVTFSDVSDAGVRILEPALREAIERALGKASGTPITADEMTTLTHLEVRSAAIRILTGLELATNLTSLRLNYNSISDISAVAGLTNLTSLRLSSNSISDISAVSGLTNLRTLYLENNSISDISAVVGLTKLTEIRLAGNSISDLSPLVANTGLGSGDSVTVTGNPLSYSSIHTHIPTLQSRGVTVLFHNRTPTTLLKISGDNQLGIPGTALANPFVVEVQDEHSNPFDGVPVTFAVTVGGGTLSETTTTTDADGRAETTLTLGSQPGTNTVQVSVEGISEPVIFTTGEEVNIPDPNLRTAIETALNKQAGAPITADEMATLTDLDANNADISDLTGLEYAINLTSLLLNGNLISDISPLVANTGLGSGDTVTVTNNPLSYASITTHLPTLQSRGVTVNFDTRTPTKLLKISGDNQLGTPGTALENPFIVEVQDQANKAFEGVPVTFTVTAGGGTLSTTSTTTDANGRAQTTLTLGSKLGTNTVSVSVEGSSNTVTFNDGVIVNIPDPNLRAKIESALNKQSGDSIVEAEMATLTDLRATHANISDLTGLEHTTNLTKLYLNNNSIADIAPVAVLTKLTSMTLGNNNISNISAATGLINLTTLELVNNSISDLSPLVSNTGLRSGDTVKVTGNSLSYLSIYTHIPTLQSRGVSVTFDPRTPTKLLKISGDNQLGIPSTALANPFVVEVQDENSNPYEGVPVTFAVTAGGGTLSETIVPTDADGRAETTLTLGSEPGTNTVQVSVEGISEPVIFNTGEEVNIPDTNLRTAIETALNKQAEEPITPAEMATLTNLDASNANISDLTGLEFATNLTRLGLANNSISDISAVAGLTNLTWLTLGGNLVSDISAVTGLTKLRWLGLSNNSISDISAVAGLANLTSLLLNGNSISDIAPLVANTQLGSGDTVNVQKNPLNYPSIYTHIPTLQSRGVTVNFDPRTPTTLLKISGDNQQGTLGTALPNPFVVEVKDQFSKAFKGVPVIFTVTAGGGVLSTQTAATDADGRAQTTLTLGIKPGPNTVRVSVEEISEPVIFNTGEGVNIPDPSLRAKIEAALTKKPGNLITTAEMATLTSLEAPNANISDLTGLEHATNLTSLGLRDNSVSNILPLAELTHLTSLDLQSNSVSDISPLAGLTNLTVLVLNGNSILDISVVSNLTNVTRLRLKLNSIADLAPLVTNTGLGSGDEIDVRENPLNYPSITTHIPTLISRGVTVEFDIRTPQTLEIVSGDTQQGVPGAVLANPFVVEVTDQHSKAFEGVPVTFTVTAGGGVLSTQIAATDPNGRAETTLTLGSKPVLNTVRVSVEGISEPVTFNTGEGVNIPDPNLRAKIKAALTKKPGNLITTAEMATLTSLEAPNANISDLTGLEHATHLTSLGLRDNSVSNILPLAELTHLTSLDLQSNSVSDISPLARLTNLTVLVLNGNSILDISVVSNLTNLTRLRLKLNSIADLAPLVTNTGLGSGDEIDVRENPLNYPSITTHIPTLISRGVTVEFDTRTPQTLEIVSGDTQQGVPGAVLANPFVVEVTDQHSKAFEGVPVTFTVTAGGGLLSTQIAATDPNGRAETTLTLGSKPVLNTVRVSVEGISEPVIFTIGEGFEFDLSVPSGLSLIHVPLKVKSVNGEPKTLESVGDLYDALGGASTVSLLITYNTQTQRWNSYLGDRYRGRPGDRTLTDDLGIIASMKTSASVRLSGDALGTDGSSSITLQQGLNLVGIPLKNPKLSKVSDLFALEGIENNVSVIIVSDNGFKLVTRPGDAGDVPITGGQSFIMTAQKAATATITGTGWFNVSETAPAAPMEIQGIQTDGKTPVLAVTGSISPVGGASLPRLFRITLKNLSTGTVHTAVTDAGGIDYQLTVVDMETGRAAQIGDILEITAQSPDAFVGVQPLRHIVTAEDVKRNWIQFGELVAYEIPAKTELLLNYPNPFNPETWIPYHLAHATDVVLTIYDIKGGLVRRFALGHQPAGFYTDRTKAAHWDGRNAHGESVASGIYFYHLKAGDYSQVRRMVIVK